MTAALSGAWIALLPKAIARRDAILMEITTASNPPPRTPLLIVHRDLRNRQSIRLVHQWVLETFAALVRD